MRDVLRVRLVSTSPAGLSGSMPAYGEELLAAFAEHVSDVDLRMVQFAGRTRHGAWARRLQMVSLVGRAVVARPDCDLWHVLDGSRAFLGTVLRKRPVVITAHDFIPVLAERGEFSGVDGQGRAARFLWQRNLRGLARADQVVAVSASTAADMARLRSGEKNQCVVLHHPVRGSLLQFSREQHDTDREQGVVLHVGNDAFYKNRGQVLEIFSLLERDIARKLVMIGPLPSSELRQWSRDLGIAERVSWIENVSDEELAGWYARASLMLLPSLYEGFGWPAIEAMAFGLPVLASDRGSLPELLGPCGPGIPPDATAQWVERARALLTSTSRRQELSARCIAHAETFNRRRFADEMRRVYLQVASRERAAA
ncbi:MAG: glycosyltransferase family 1 protein [Arenicellales bacterium]